MHRAIITPHKAVIQHVSYRTYDTYVFTFAIITQVICVIRKGDKLLLLVRYYCNHCMHCIYMLNGHHKVLNPKVHMTYDIC